MSYRAFGRFLAAALVLSSASAPAVAQGASLPAGFFTEEVVPGWNQPIDFAFLADGRAIVAEKEGLLWLVTAGTKSAQPILDITEEVGNAASRGLKSFTVDPDFLNNGYVYLLYEVDRHHLFFFGTPQYDPLVTDNNGPTIGRLTRFTLDGSNGFESEVPGSRLVLVGETPSTGFPAIDNHETGCVRFGDDGSLLATSGDGTGGEPDFGGDGKIATAIAEGIMTVGEDVGSYRSQQLDSLCGKLVRVDPATGDGLPSNPFYDGASPRSARSRTWSYGLRNPFRIQTIDGTSMGQGDPGTIVIAEVGRGQWEEISVSRGGGENFGWPIYEGLEEIPLFADVSIENPLAPNPLFGVSGCTNEFFTFQELIVQETLGVPSWPNPCDGGTQIPPTSDRSVHTRPVIEWGHIGTSRAGDFDLNGDAIVVELTDPSSPIPGSSFVGRCAIGGAWYETGPYPTEFEDSFFFADYASNWIRRLEFHNGMHVHGVEDFAESVGDIVAMDIDPISGELYYLQIVTPDFDGALVRVGYTAGDGPPQADANRAPFHAPSPLVVQFDGSNSRDPEDLPLSFSWDFGDGTPPSTLENPIHVFPSEDVSALGTANAQVIGLDPPQAINTAPGFFPIAVNDGVFVDPAAPVLAFMYLTFYDGDGDSDDVDWVALEFPTDHEFHKLVFQEGSEFATLGGWFEDVTVEVRTAGVWSAVSNLIVSPPYGGQNGVNFDVYEFVFDGVVGDGIRLIGTPGGTDGFVSVGEMVAISRPVTTGEPTRHDVTLTVRDEVNQTAQAQTSVWTDNTPPVPGIVSPVNGGLYDPFMAQIVSLEATRSDAESLEGDLDCEWTISLHHNDHVHPEPLDPNCSSSVALAAHGAPDEVYFWEMQLTVTDPQGLSASRTALLYPETPSLLAQSYHVSLLGGGTTTFQLDAGPAHADEFYWVFMNATGVFPGLDFGGGNVLPLNFDKLFLLTLKSPFLGIFGNFVGQLDASGQAAASFTVPPGTDPELAGIVLNFAYVSGEVLGQVDFASNPTQLRFGD